MSWRAVQRLDRTDADTAEDLTEDDELEAEGAPAVYWYTFPAYKRGDGPYPIKVGRGTVPLKRIAQQVTGFPEAPEVLRIYEHSNVNGLERALHAVLTVRGKRKTDAPGSEWFITTPLEVKSLIDLIPGPRPK